MKITKIKKWAAALACACILPFASNVSGLTFTDANYVGKIVNGAPSSDVNQASYINYLITLGTGAGSVQLGGVGGEFYDRINSTIAGPFATAVAVGADREDPTDGSIDATGFVYVYAKYGGFSSVWYNPAGFSGVITVPTAKLSHLSLHNPGTSVPDGGATLALVGLAIAGLGLARRKLS